MIRQAEPQTWAWGFLIARISAAKKPVEGSCEVMQIQSRCSSWSGLVPDVCLYEKYAPWISLASGGECWWFHRGTVSLPVTGPKMVLSMNSSFCQSSSWFCNANKVHGFTQGLCVLMTKPLQVWGRETLRNFLLWKGILLLGWFESQFMASGHRQLLLLLPN